MSLVIGNDEWNTNLGQVSGSPLPHPTRLPPELLKITNMQPGPHTKKVPGHNCFQVMENEKMEKKKKKKPSIIPSQDSTAPSPSSTSFPLRQLPASACLYNQRETELALIWMSYPHSPGFLMMTSRSTEFHSIRETCRSGLGETLGAQSLSSHLGCDHRGFLRMFFFSFLFFNTSSRAEELVRAQRFKDATVWNHNITVRPHSSATNLVWSKENSQVLYQTRLAMSCVGHSHLALQVLNP